MKRPSVRVALSPRPLSNPHAPSPNPTQEREEESRAKFSSIEIRNLRTDPIYSPSSGFELADAIFPFFRRGRRGNHFASNLHSNISLIKPHKRQSIRRSTRVGIPDEAICHRRDAVIRLVIPTNCVDRIVSSIHSYDALTTGISTRRVLHVAFPSVCKLPILRYA